MSGAPELGARRARAGDELLAHLDAVVHRRGADGLRDERRHVAGAAADVEEREAGAQVEGVEGVRVDRGALRWRCGTSPPRSGLSWYTFGSRRARARGRPRSARRRRTRSRSRPSARRLDASASCEPMRWRARSRRAEPLRHRARGDNVAHVALSPSPSLRRAGLPRHRALASAFFAAVALDLHHPWRRLGPRRPRHPRLRRPSRLLHERDRPI